MIKLSKRLDSIASLVPLNSRVIDVGCDHALLDIYLYQNKKVKKIIASDVNENALDNAKANIRKNKLENDIETRLGNGLDTLNDEDDIDTVIISGMGAHTAVGILKNNLNKLASINTIIIQSNTKLVFLRKEVTKLNYMIQDEEIVLDSNKVYTIIKFVKGKKRYNYKELYFGPILLKKNSKLFREYNQKELEKLELFLKLMPKNRLLDKYKLKKEIRLYDNIII